MDGPQPPRDASLRNIIDKLAEFVARNGPEFEMITKQKQQDNPKFEFLYGGEFASYYQYRVAAEHAFLKQQQQGALSQAPPTTHHMHHQQQGPSSLYAQAPPTHMQQSHDSNAPNAFGMNHPPPGHMWGGAPNATPMAQQQQQQQQQQANGNALAVNLKAQIEGINMQQSSLREQIHQSESNLSAQHSALMAQQSKQIEESIETAQNTQLETQADENGIQLREFNSVLQPIIESCTKDSISAGKNWILQHSSDSAKNNVVLQYLLKKALRNGSTFQQKLHLIYLVNDILHHCVRKGAHDLKNSLENVVIPMFCSADLIASNDQRAKLTKLLTLWESKAKFFDACVISKLKSPDSSMQEYKTNLQNLHHEIASKFAQATKATLDNYQKQHQIFIQHATQQIAQLEQQKQQLEQQILATVLPNTSVMPPQQAQQQLSVQQPVQHQQQQQQLQPNKVIPSLMSQKISMPGAHDDSLNSSASSVEHMKPPGVDEGYAVGSGNNNNNAMLLQQQQQQQQTPHKNPFSGSSNFQTKLPQQQQQQAPPPSTLQQQQQQQQHNPFSNEAPKTSNFFIPDLSKPPPGFMGGVAALAAQLPPALQQQFAQISSNIAPTSAAAAAAAMAIANDSANAATVASNVNVDLLALNSAIQLVKQQQQQQQHQHQHQHQQQQQLQLESTSTMSPQMQQPQQQQLLDDELPPPPPQMSAPEEEQKPSAPYYDLPAGLMVPLIRLEDYNYKPLDPDEIRLPPPTPQSERLTNALAAFYAPPTHDRPRDTEGWEKLGLYEYYKVKNAARKQKEEEIQNGLREKSRSPSPIVLEKPKPKKINKRSYRSKSRSRSRTRSPYRSRSRSPPARPSRGGAGGGGGADNRSGGGGRAGGRYKRDRNERSSDRGERDSSSSSRENRAERNSTRRERERSVTPPSFFGSTFTKPNEFIEESNKGHQMLMKMGWGGSGTGLGTKNQGIDQPISGGEVRDRKDMYKGVGINLNDPFENFRKNKGAAFVHRMRARDDKS